jgi:hypothetical protein
MKPITLEEAMSEAFIGDQRERVLALLDEHDAARKELLEYRELKRNKCDTHDGARVQCGQCFDSQAQNLENARADAARLREALSWAMLHVPKPGPHDHDGYMDTYWSAHGELTATDSAQWLTSRDEEMREEGERAVLALLAIADKSASPRYYNCAKLTDAVEEHDARVRSEQATTDYDGYAALLRGAEVLPPPRELAEALAEHDARVATEACERMAKLRPLFLDEQRIRIAALADNEFVKAALEARRLEALDAARDAAYEAISDVAENEARAISKGSAPYSVKFRVAVLTTDIDAALERLRGGER